MSIESKEARHLATIRKATQEDVEALAVLSARLADHHHAIDGFWKEGNALKEEFKTAIQTELGKETSLVLAIEADAKIVGYFSAEIVHNSFVKTEEKSGKIANAYLDEEYRGKGAAKEAMEKIFEWLRANGIQTVELSVGSHNVEGVRAWEGLGFIEYSKKMKRAI